MWKLGRSNRFKRKWKTLGQQYKNRAVEALSILSNSDDPGSLGELKVGKWHGYYAWELGRGCRIIYRPHYVENELELARICDHKEYQV